MSKEDIQWVMTPPVISHPVKLYFIFLEDDQLRRLRLGVWFAVPPAEGSVPNIHISIRAWQPTAPPRPVNAGITAQLLYAAPSPLVCTINGHRP
jgi:hypothetical protein